MKNDPFALLGIDAGASKADLARAFSGARTRGIAMTDARKAFDSLRDPVTTEAMSILAISQTGGYRDLLSRDEADPTMEAVELVIGAASAILLDLETHLDSSDVLPRASVARDVRDYVPAPMEELEP